MTYALPRHRQLPRVDARLRSAVEAGDVISLAGGVPADDLFPADGLARAMAEVMAGGGSAALQYGWPCGLDPLRSEIVAWLGRRGATVREDQVLVTAGAQQGLFLLACALLRDGDGVVVETPTYASALQALEVRRARLLGVRRTAVELDRDALVAALPRSRMLYLVAAGHNPTGGVLSAADRESILDDAAAAGVPVVDDDAYGPLQLGADPLPPLAGRPGVLHLGSFSKVLAPGLRVGFVVGPEPLVRDLAAIKAALDLETATLSQQVLARWLATSSLDDHVARCLPVYRARRDALVDALADHCAHLGRWEHPEAGFSLLFRPHGGPPAADRLDDAIRGGVAFEPAAPYHVDPAAGATAFRLSFANLRPDRLREGVGRLAVSLGRREWESG